MNKISNHIAFCLQALLLLLVTLVIVLWHRNTIHYNRKTENPYTARYQLLSIKKQFQIYNPVIIKRGNPDKASA